MKPFHIVCVESSSKFGFCNNVYIDCIFNAFRCQNVGMCVYVPTTVSEILIQQVARQSQVYHATPNHYFINDNI